MLPSLSGMGAPYWDPQARGSFHNITLGSTRADFARAALEGIAAGLADCLDAIRETAGIHRFSSVACSGGMTASPLYNQIQCDTWQTPLRVFSDAESTVRGAWISASVTLGIHSSHAGAFSLSAGRERTRFHEPDEELGRLYNRIRADRNHIYETLAARRAETRPHGVSAGQ
jgi:glycerol kinase